MPLHENDEATGDQGGGVGQAYDIVFVGSGLSSSCTLAALIEQVGAGPMGRALRVAVVEKADHFFTGIPYGARSGTASLIITPVDEFLPSPEREAFMAWLARHQDRVMADIEAKGGPLSQDFLARSREAIASGDCSSFHMPRYTFGLYLREKMQARLDDAERKGQLAYRLMQGEVVDIRRDDQGYDLVLEEGARIRSRLVVLALGTPPNRSLFDPAARSASKACLVEDPYLPDMEATLERIQQSLTEPGAGGERHVLLVGANATSLEMLYNLNNLPGLQERGLHFHILAPQGKLPDRFRQIETPRLETVHLNALEGQADLTAAAILEAVKADLAAAKEQSLGIADTLPMISKAVGKLVQELALEEKKTFVRHVGIEIGRLQRRAGDEYSDIADDLQRQGRLKIVAGRFTGFAEHEADGVRVLYEAGPDGERQTLAASIDVVVNCTGSAGMSRPNVSPLIEALLASGLCRANESGAGFAVNHRMEAAEDLFVIGPLLAGNVVGDLSIWHVEHCGRIMEFSKTLARSLHDDLLEAA